MTRPYPTHPDLIEEQRAFLLARQDGLYSTDSPAVLGLSRWGTPMSVYLDKTEPPNVQVPSIQAWLGWALEDAVATLYAERYAVPVPLRDDGTYRHPDYHWLATHLDYRDGTTLVECKTRQRRGPDWGEDGTGKVPPDIWVQVQHEMAATGSELTVVAVLFGLGHAFHTYPIPRDDGFIERLIPKLETFWTANVLQRMAPELTAGVWDATYSKRHEQREGAGLLPATPEQEAFLKRYRLSRIVVKQAEAAQTAIETQLRELIGENEGITGSVGTVTYRTGKPSRAWEVIAGTYRQLAEQLLEMANPGDDEAAVGRLAHVQSLLPLVEDMYSKPGTRRLDVRLREEDADE